jgi:hypothetical protein
MYQRVKTDGHDCGAISGMDKRQGKPKYLAKTCRSAALSATDLTGLQDFTWARTLRPITRAMARPLTTESISSHV